MITRWALNNSMLVLILVLMIAAAGPSSFLSHPSREDPEITIRTALVTASFPGMSPQRMEDLITKKLEEKVREMPEVDKIRSTSRSGQATVRVELHDRITELEPVWQDLRNKMSDVKGDLPSGTSGPFVNDNYGDVAMATVALTAEGFSLAELEAEYGRDEASFVSMRDLKLESSRVSLRKDVSLAKEEEKVPAAGRSDLEELVWFLSAF